MQLKWAVRRMLIQMTWFCLFEKRGQLLFFHVILKNNSTRFTYLLPSWAFFSTILNCQNPVDACKRSVQLFWFFAQNFSHLPYFYPLLHCCDFETYVHNAVTLFQAFSFIWIILYCIVRHVLHFSVVYSYYTHFVRINRRI